MDVARSVEHRRVGEIRLSSTMNNWKAGDVLIRKLGPKDPPYEILSTHDQELHLVIDYDPETDALDVLTARGTRVKEISGKMWAITYEVLQ